MSCGWARSLAVEALVASAALAGAALGGCGAGPPGGFTLEIQSFGVNVDCAASPQIISVVATVVLDDTAGDDDATVVPVRARFDVLGHSLRVPLDGSSVTVEAGAIMTVELDGMDSTPADVCSACDMGPLSSFVAPTFVFHVNGERVEALPPPSALVCD